MAAISEPVVGRRGDIHETTMPGRLKAKRNFLQKIRREFYMGRDSVCRNFYSYFR